MCHRCICNLISQVPVIVLYLEQKLKMTHWVEQIQQRVRDYHAEEGRPYLEIGRDDHTAPPETVPWSDATKAALEARPDVNRYWAEEMDRHNYTRVAEFGTVRHFPPATTFVAHLGDQSTEGEQERITHNLDLDVDGLPLANNSFDFVYCRHLMQTLHNPVGAFREMARLSRRGYIETPSPLIESLEQDHVSGGLAGHPLHRFVFWTDAASNTLYVLPKFPIIDTMPRTQVQVRQWVQISQDHPQFFNNYYQWDVDAGLMPRIVMLRHPADFNVDDPATYSALIDRGAQLSVDYTQDFFRECVQQQVIF